MSASTIRIPKLSIEKLPENWHFPTTRYRGSKRKILPWIWEAVKDLRFDSALDLFGGTAAVSILFKRMGKQVYYNDYLRFNQISGISFIQNKSTKLTEADIFFLTRKHEDIKYENFIQETFEGFYYPDEENQWLDITIKNITELSRYYTGRMLQEKRSLAMWSLGQACLMKRPFNLFHRKNLNLRTNEVVRRFGNKTSWERPFPDLFLRFAKEANDVVFDNEKENVVLECDAFKLKQKDYGLVYLDPPYIYRRQHDNDYHDIYHFLEGLSDYENWRERIDWQSKNLRLNGNRMIWPTKSDSELTELYEQIINEFKDSIIVISHKSNSLVGAGQIAKLLHGAGKTVTKKMKRYRYALNKHNGKPGKNIEWLIIGN